MGSIGSTLNSINQSLLTEIQSFSGNGTSTGNTTSTSSTSTSDKVDFSQAGDLFKQLQQLQTSNPTEFKQVLTDAAAKFKDAASQQSDPKAAAFLNNLADRFQKAADTGDISALHPQSPAGASGGGGVHGHHGHHGGGHKADSSTDDDTDSTTSTTPTSSIANPSTTSSSGDPLNSALTSSQSLFSLLDTSGSNNADILTAAVNALQSSTTPGTTTDQITSLLGSFVTSNS